MTRLPNLIGGPTRAAPVAPSQCAWVHPPARARTQRRPLPQRIRGPLSQTLRDLIREPEGELHPRRRGETDRELLGSGCFARRLDKPSVSQPNDSIIALAMALDAIANQPEPV